MLCGGIAGIAISLGGAAPHPAADGISLGLHGPEGVLGCLHCVLGDGQLFGGGAGIGLVHLRLGGVHAGAGRFELALGGADIGGGGLGRGDGGGHGGLRGSDLFRAGAGAGLGQLGLGGGQGAFRLAQRTLGLVTLGDEQLGIQASEHVAGGDGVTLVHQEFGDLAGGFGGHVDDIGLDGAGGGQPGGGRGGRATAGDDEGGENEQGEQ